MDASIIAPEVDEHSSSIHQVEMRSFLPLCKAGLTWGLNGLAPGTGLYGNQVLDEN